MIHESKCGWAIVPIIQPKLDAAEVLGVLVTVVRRRDQSQWRPVIDRQRPSVQCVREKNVVGQEIVERQAGAIAVLAPENDETGITARARMRQNDLLEEI
jgi:hypothetical protein